LRRTRRCKARFGLPDDGTSRAESQVNETEASNMVDAKQLKATLQRELDSLVRTRDELRVQASLATAGARKEWDRLETGLLRVQDEIKRMGEHSKDAVHEVATASRTLLEELKHGFDRIKHDLQAR
jgi:hypothetical protein